MNIIQVDSILNHQVAMKNVVARSAQSLSLSEKRIVLAAIARLDSRLPRAHYLPPERRRIRVSARDYAELADVDMRLAYRDLMAACERLFDRYLRIVVDTPKGRKEIKRRWVEAVVYHHGEGYVEVTVATEILPHLVELRGRFLTYRLKQAEGLRSIYSWRFLEFLTSFSGDQGTVVVPLDDLRHALEIPESYQWYDIKRKVIQVAVEELRLKDSWDITWEVAGRNRKSVAAVRFRWKRDPQQDMFRRD